MRKIIASVTFKSLHMKKFTILFSSLLMGISVFAFDPGKMDKKLLQLFNASFPNAENVTWEELPNSYVLSFVENGIRTRVRYKNDGSYGSNITRYYLEIKLPATISASIKDSNPDKKIFGVTEVTSVTSNCRQTEYYVILEGEKAFTTVKADKEGNIVVVDKFRKAK
jgi:hypothetical protein